MYKRSIRRRRAVVLLLVALSIGLLTAYFRESAAGGLHAVQRGVMEVLSPLQAGASRAIKPARDLVGWAGDALHAKSENRKLKRDVSELRAQIAASQTAQRENAELRKLVGLDSLPNFRAGRSLVTARVIARSPTVFNSTITIDKGSSSGIHTDQAVVSGDGLVGHVTAAAPHAAQVTLITDHTSAVSAQIVPDGATGLVQPAVGNPNDLLLNFIEKGKPVRKGATVVSAGWRSGKLESLFPRGIPVGRITQAGEIDQKIYQRAHLKPFADLRRFDVVQVLRRAPRDAGAQFGGAGP